MGDQQGTPELWPRWNSSDPRDRYPLNFLFYNFFFLFSTGYENQGCKYMNTCLITFNWRVGTIYFLLSIDLDTNTFIMNFLCVILESVILFIRDRFSITHRRTKPRGSPMRLGASSSKVRVRLSFMLWGWLSPFRTHRHAM